MSNIKGLVNEFLKQNSESVNLTDATRGVSVGIVVDTDDPLEQGRVRIFCPAYNDDPKKLLHLPWAAYVSPVGGVVNNPQYARGHIPGQDRTSGAVHYGFWAIPEIGAHTLVACINNDPRRRVWMGCLPSHQETHTLGNGRFTHRSYGVDGPLSSDQGAIQPTYTKLKEAFEYQIASSEWKTRGVDYQVTAVRAKPTEAKSNYFDTDNRLMGIYEPDSWVKEKLGDHGYDWTGHKNLGSFLASRVYSWSTPGFHSIQMDDRAFNSRIRIRTTAGSQIILDDTNERMYFSVSGGKSWLEMDASGNVDIYAERRFSVHAGKDINFSADDSIRFKAGKHISMYAGTASGQTPLAETLRDGEIRIHASDDLHIMTQRDLQLRVNRHTAGTFGTVQGGTKSGHTNLTFNDEVNIGLEAALNISALDNINLSSPDITFTISGHGTTVRDLTTWLDTYVATYNSHTHIGAGTNLNHETELPIPAAVVIVVAEDATKFAPWTNRVPDHEPWPRVLMQDANYPINSINGSYRNNVDWIPQFNNAGRAGREPVGVWEGDESVSRGPFWRR